MRVVEIVHDELQLVEIDVQTVEQVELALHVKTVTLSEAPTEEIPLEIVGLQTKLVEAQVQVPSINCRLP